MKPPALPVSAPVGGRKTIIPKNQIFSLVAGMQTTRYNKPKLSQAALDRTQSPDFLFFDQFFCSALQCLQIYSYACSDQQDSLGWSQRLNLYWWPSTHPLALGLTLLRIIGNFLASDRAIDRQGFGVLSSSSQILSLTNPLTGTNRRLTFPRGRGWQ